MCSARVSCTYQRESSEELLNVERTDVRPTGGNAGRAGSVSLVEAQKAYIIQVYKYLKGGCKEGRARLSPVVSADRLRAQTIEEIALTIIYIESCPRFGQNDFNFLP